MLKLGNVNEHIYVEMCTKKKVQHFRLYMARVTNMELNLRLFY